jgi:Transglutaminase-like enzymes, putative cysteine proteases
MLLQVLHRTTFVYAGPVRDSFNEVRLRPVDDCDQQARRFDLRLTPAAGDIRDYVDYYGNRVHYFDLPGAHDCLVIEAESQIETTPDSRRAPIPAIPCPRHHGVTAADELYAEYLVDSHYVPLSVELRHELQEFRTSHDPADAWHEVRSLGGHVYRTFTYKPGATRVSTVATEALSLRAGVCQDFAHVMIGLCRLAGFPARYVSGYFFNPDRRPDEPEASHAWVEVHLAGYGWAAYDPTHDRPADERYIKVAAGRDYGDVRPVSGTYRGAPTKELRVEVSVRETR